MSYVRLRPPSHSRPLPKARHKPRKVQAVIASILVISPVVSIS
jgi:hypothetical protein